MALRLLSFFFMSCLLGASTAQSSVVTYTLTGGTVTGTLGGVSFSAATYTITADADPTNFSLGDLGGAPLLTQPAVTTMTIAGISPFQITLANFGPLLLDISNDYGPGFAVGGFGVQINANGFNGISTQGAASSLSGPVSVTGILLVPAGPVFTTTAGDLIFTDSDGTATFTGEFEAVPVPEPTSLTIFGLGAVGMAAFRARRKTRA